MKVWITKYALTKGVFEVEGEVKDNCFIGGNVIAGWYYASYLGKQWHRTKADALDEAERMRDAKVKSLRKQITKLEAMTFDV